MGFIRELAGEGWVFGRGLVGVREAWAGVREGRVGVRAEEGVGVLTQHVEKSVEKSGRPGKFILLEIPRKAAAGALKHGNPPTESGTPEG